MKRLFGIIKEKKATVVFFELPAPADNKRLALTPFGK
jgi:hypothetical protein